MASQKVEAAIKGSIANPEAAQKVIDNLDAVSNAGELEPLEEEAILADVVAKVNELIAALKG